METKTNQSILTCEIPREKAMDMLFTAHLTCWQNGTFEDEGKYMSHRLSAHLIELLYKLFGGQLKPTRDQFNALCHTYNLFRDAGGTQGFQKARANSIREYISYRMGIVENNEGGE